MTERLQQALGLRFRDPGLLRLALTHRSHAFEAGGVPTNERLEFLGDAVLGVVVTDWIYHRFEEASEGRLAKVRAAAVNTHSLADIARDLDLGQEVLLGKGEEQSGGRDKDSILADTLEAVIGAVYLDQGHDAVAELVRRLFSVMLEDISRRRESLDYKTSLQEVTAGELGTLPSYLLSEKGPDHEKTFTAIVTVAGEALGTGTGRSKKEAEQAAAQVAYAVLRERFAVVSEQDGGPRGSSPGPDGGAPHEYSPNEYS